MKRRLSGFLLAAAVLPLSLLPLSLLQAGELTGRVSFFGSGAQAQSGDFGYVNADDRTPGADQQSLRLMLEDVQKNTEWSLHLKTRRQHTKGYPLNQLGSSDLFRYKDLADDWLDHTNLQSNSATRVGYEIDRAVYKRNFDNTSLALGRQPIDWGSGRLWQPLNVFGAFAPTDLDTDFKPGIDAAVFDWFPSDFSSLTAAYVLAPTDNNVIKDSGAIYYRRQVGSTSEMALLAGRVIGSDLIGASFESELGGMGWRVEALHSNPEQTNDNELFWVAGVDYQFAGGTFIAVEWYQNSQGASTEQELTELQRNQQFISGLQPQLGKRVLGLTAQRDLTPLWNGNYTLLLSTLKNASDQSASSVLHQFSLIYSVSDEADLLLSFLYANGKGVNKTGQVQSEFGHIPASVTARLRFYF